MCMVMGLVHGWLFGIVNMRNIGWYMSSISTNNINCDMVGNLISQGIVGKSTQLDFVSISSFMNSNLFNKTLTPSNKKSPNLNPIWFIIQKTWFSYKKITWKKKRIRYEF
jgi:hypothetical protein